MLRAFTLLATFVSCLAAWLAFYFVGIFAVMRWWQWVNATDAAGVLSAALTIGGLSMILIGVWLRFVAKTSIDSPLRFPLMSSARFVVGIGALITFGGAGAVLANGVSG
jgi:hypothetical protein